MKPTHESRTDGSVAYVKTRNHVVVTFTTSEDGPLYTLPTPSFDRKYRPRPGRVVFFEDPDSGFSIEIYFEPDADGSMEYLGRLDLFSAVLYVEGGPTIEIPFDARRDRWTTEEWVVNTLDKLGTTCA